MTRLTVNLCAVAALAAFVAACGGDDSSSKSSSGASSGGASKQQKHYTITYANVADSSPLFKLVGDKMVSDGKKVGITVKRFDNNFDPSKALSNAQLMVQQKPDLIVDWTGTESIGKSVGAVFSRAKIPCIAVNQTIEGCPYFNLQNKLLGSGAAEIVAPAMKEKGWTAADTTTVFLFNPGAGAEVNSNGRYFYSDLAKRFPEMKQAAPDEITDKVTTFDGDGPNLVQINGKDALEPSYQAMKQELTVLPKDRHLVVFTQNDDSALGAWRAITQAKREDDTMIIGQGANADGLKNLPHEPVLGRRGQRVLRAVVAVSDRDGGLGAQRREDAAADARPADRAVEGQRGQVLRRRESGDRLAPAGRRGPLPAQGGRAAEVRDRREQVSADAGR